MPTDTSLLQAALIGYETERERLVKVIADIESQLGRRGSARVAKTSVGKRGPRRISAAARKRIAAAQKKRWAAYRKGKKAT